MKTKMKADFKKWLKGKRKKIQAWHLNIFLKEINEYAEDFAKQYHEKKMKEMRKPHDDWYRKYYDENNKNKDES